MTTTTESMVYLIESEYVGPNTHDSAGNILGDTAVMSICRAPGTTNMTHQERTEGWLGTTNDGCLNALGEFKTVDAARDAAHQLGFTAEYSDEDECGSRIADDDIVEQWVRPGAAREQYEAEAWFEYTGRAGVAAEWNITADSTEEAVATACELAEEKAVAEGAEVHGIYDYMLFAREELRNDEWLDAETRERIALCTRYGVSLFASRRDDRPAS